MTSKEKDNILELMRNFLCCNIGKHCKTCLDIENCDEKKLFEAIESLPVEEDFIIWVKKQFFKKLRDSKV